MSDRSLFLHVLHKTKTWCVVSLLAVEFVVVPEQQVACEGFGVGSPLVAVQFG